MELNTVETKGRRVVRHWGEVGLCDLAISFGTWRLLNLGSYHPTDGERGVLSFWMITF